MRPGGQSAGAERGHGVGGRWEPRLTLTAAGDVSPVTSDSGWTPRAGRQVLAWAGASPPSPAGARPWGLTAPGAGARGAGPATGGASGTSWPYCRLLSAADRCKEVQQIRDQHPSKIPVSPTAPSHPCGSRPRPSHASPAPPLGDHRALQG